MRELLTIGHGCGGRSELVDRLGGVDLLVDVRRFPGSRNNPDVGRDALAEWLPEEGIAYRWEERLGGRRRLPHDVASPDSWWRVEAFRAYAAHTRTPEFLDGFHELLAEASQRQTVIMCSESVWWRCHRRLISDVAVLAHSVPVSHLMPGGRTSEHRPADGARVGADGMLVWDGPDGSEPVV